MTGVCAVCSTALQILSLKQILTIYLFCRDGGQSGPTCQNVIRYSPNSCLLPSH